MHAHSTLTYTQALKQLTMVQFKCSNLLLATRITTLEDPDWPHGAHYGYALADAGFFYLGRGDTVQCCKCDLQLCRWDTKNDDPIAEHGRESPNCELKFQQKVDSCFRPPQDEPCTPRSMCIGRHYDNQIAVEHNNNNNNNNNLLLPNTSYITKIIYIIISKSTTSVIQGNK